MSAIQSNSLGKLGYNDKSPMLTYGISKAALIALTRVEVRQWSGAKNVLVLSVCPGYCATDMNAGRQGARPPELGADSILHPVNAPANMNWSMVNFIKMVNKNHRVLHVSMDFSAIQTN